MDKYKENEVEYTERKKNTAIYSIKNNIKMFSDTKQTLRKSAWVRVENLSSRSNSESQRMSGMSRCWPLNTTRIAAPCSWTRSPLSDCWNSWRMPRLFWQACSPPNTSPPCGTTRPCGPKNLRTWQRFWSCGCRFRICGSILRLCSVTQSLRRNSS